MDFFSEMTVTDISGVFTVYHSKGNSSRMINRQRFGLCFCTEGKISFYHQGKEYVCDPHHALFLPKNASYEFVSHAKGAFPMINFLCDTNFFHPSLEVLPIESVSPYTYFLKRIADLLLSAKNADRFHALSVFYELLATISNDSSLSGKAAVLKTAIDFLEKNYTDPNLTIRALADCSYISEVYFRRLFHENFRMPPKLYIKNLRIRHAKELLKNPLLSVSAVAEQSGYRNIYHFCRDFKSSVGCTPSDFRRATTSIAL